MPALAGAAGWVVVGRAGPAAGAATAPPPGLPAGLNPYRRIYRNWAGDVVTDEIWTVSVRHEQDVVDLANWARNARFTLRPKGFAHNWAPFTVAPGRQPPNVLLVDTTSGLTKVSVGAAGVTAGAGVSMDRLLAVLDAAGRGLAQIPAVGDITLGGMLAIGAHGAGVPAAGERASEGHGYGSLSNLITALRAVVWDSGAGAYVARTFTRAEPDIGALLVHLGRAFVTEVSLRTGARQQMRCRSYTSISSDELFAPPGTRGRTLASFVESAGRVEALWYPFTRTPWLKVWSLSPGWFPPFGARPSFKPYNYTFADVIPEPIARLVAQVAADPRLTPSFGAALLSGTQLGLLATVSSDLWGRASYLQRFVRPTTLRMLESGHAVLCRRSDIQWVVNGFADLHRRLLESYAARGLYPINGPVEIRVNAVDDPAVSGVPGAVDPWLSPVRRRPDRPDWDTVVWLSSLTMPGTLARDDFFTELEAGMFGRFEGERSTMRAEWSKGWAYAAAGPYTNDAALDTLIPAVLDAGQPAGTRFADAVAVLDRLDPHRIFTSPLLDRLLRRPAGRPGALSMGMNRTLDGDEPHSRRG